MFDPLSQAAWFAKTCSGKLPMQCCQTCGENLVTSIRLCFQRCCGAQESTENVTPVTGRLVWNIASPQKCANWVQPGSEKKKKTFLVTFLGALILAGTPVF